jgi:hypothetical protein
MEPSKCSNTLGGRCEFRKEMRFHSSTLVNSSHLRVLGKLGLQEGLEVELGVGEIGNDCNIATIG